MQPPRDDERIGKTDRRNEKAASTEPRPQRFVPTEKLIEALSDGPTIDFEQFRKDLYSIVDPSPRDWFEE